MEEIIKIIAFCLLTACFISFSWAVIAVFQKPNEKMPTKMYILGILSNLFFFGQLALLFKQNDQNLGIAIIGLLLLSLSLGLFWSAVPYAKSIQLGIAFAKKTSPKILMEGPYKFIRHPFYTSYLMFWFAAFLVIQSYCLLISVVVMAWFYFSAINEEETMLLNSEMGELYKSYRLKTGAILPRLRN